MKEEYYTRKEAMEHRKNGEIVYYNPKKGYYLVSNKKKDVEFLNNELINRKKDKFIGSIGIGIFLFCLSFGYAVSSIEHYYQGYYFSLLVLFICSIFLLK